MPQFIDRRQFLQNSVAATAAVGLAGLAGQALAQAKPLPFKISLAEWSLHLALRANKLTNMDFAKVSKEEYGIDAIEYVNQFFKDKAKDQEYLTELKKRSTDLGVTTVLIMIDGEGALGAAKLADRVKAVENHYKWVEAAKFLGCHSIRVNAQSAGSREDQMYRAADGLRALSEFADPHNINIIVENHGGWSSNGEWLVETIKKADHKRCGTLPDFGNFNVGMGQPPYDRYKGTAELMPFAKGVSAKSYDFTPEGDETTIDFYKLMKIVVDAGYHGYVGIEYEGTKGPEPEGIKATKKLLEKIQKQMMA